MNIIEGKSLADVTTFRIGGPARFFCSAASADDIRAVFAFAWQKSLPVFVLGGGSNVLVSDKGFDGLVVKIEIKGISIASVPSDTFSLRAIPGLPVPSTRPEGSSGSSPREVSNGTLNLSDSIYIRVGAGENWDEFVAWSVSHGYGGLENLSLIPGSVGAAPVQNVGAYGVEVGNLIEEVQVFDTASSSLRKLANSDCNFSYRDSVFKHEKGRYVITSVLFKLKKDSTPNISYKDLKEYFDTTSKAGNPSIAEVRQAVIAIRTAKLPDVKKVGTAGSFFKNPIVSKDKFDDLKKTYAGLPGFPEADDRIKIPLAWIVDKVCSLKGKRFGLAGIHDTQAIVIVNYGGAMAADIEMVAHEIEKVVKEKTGIEIEREVAMV